MSERVVDLHLFDILIAILKIENTSKQFSNSQELLHSYTHWDSVIREFEIIGEASKHLIQKNYLPRKHRAVVDFRNKIIHEYFGIDHEEVWNILHNDLPPFKKIILENIEKLPTDLQSELINAFIEDNKHLKFITKTLEQIKNTPNNS